MVVKIKSICKDLFAVSNGKMNYNTKDKTLLPEERGEVDVKTVSQVIMLPELYKLLCP